MIQDSESGVMSAHEPMLDIMFSPREKEAQPAELLYFQDVQAIFLCNIPDSRLGEYFLRDRLGHAIEDIGDKPIKHFH